MSQYPPPDPSSARAQAAAALLSALREVREVLDRLQLTAAWVLEAYGDTTDAETIRMLPVGGRPGRPPVPPPPAPSVTGDESDPEDEKPCPDCWSSVGWDDLGRCKTCGRDR